MERGSRMAEAFQRQEREPVGGDDLFDLFGDVVAFRPEGSRQQAEGSRRAREAAEAARFDALSVAAE